jgi:SAM-dependent methyltransferase
MKTDSHSFETRLSDSEYPRITWEQAVCWLRDQPELRQLVLDAYYDDPLVAAAERYWLSAEWTAVRELIGDRRGRALDVGAGRGIASYALARDGFEVTALEPDGSSVVGAAAIRVLQQESGLPIRVTQEFSETLPYPDLSFDVVFARAVLHHASDLKATCRELRRVLKSGGMLITLRDHVISRREDLPEFLASHPLHSLYGGENAFLIFDYRAALTGAALKIEREIGPFDSVVNYAPNTPDTLRCEIANRLGPLGAVANAALKPRPIMGATLRVLSKFDRRPGRLVSFVCRKAN